MTKWLASVQSLEEVQILLPILPDILDMKDPYQGALGALSVDIVSQIVSLVDGKCQTSATIGDLPMQAKIICPAITQMATSGVDYVKIGLFPNIHLTECIQELADTVTLLKTPVIAVIFADNIPDIEYIPLLKASGFAGVMVDTAFKNGQHLLDHWDREKLISFIDTARKNNMICGLAGALRIDDIALLKPLQADYLGFRSALCQQHQRTTLLQKTLAQKIQQAITL